MSCTYKGAAQRRRVFYRRLNTDVTESPYILVQWQRAHAPLYTDRTFQQAQHQNPHQPKITHHVTATWLNPVVAM